MVLNLFFFLFGAFGSVNSREWFQSPQIYFFNFDFVLSIFVVSTSGQVTLSNSVRLCTLCLNKVFIFIP